MSYNNIDTLLSKVDSRFTLVILAAKRARQLNDYINSLHSGELTLVKAPDINSIHEKPLSIALGEIETGEITYKREADDSIK